MIPPAGRMKRNIDSPDPNIGICTLSCLAPPT